ncbi:MAG: Gfo/Idh/MocA family oxidoreductase [Eubacteriales bacterium]|nr:Gfo/Idh/MocA family oxidoreductase [Eubacteriales bacterium]
MEAQSFGNSVKLAIVGCGKQAEKFFQANRFHRQMEILAVCGKSMQEAMEFAARKGRMYYSDDLNALADWDGVEAVYIACGLKERYETAVRMLEAGKHLLIEAPMAESHEEVEKLYQLAEEKNVILMEAIPSIYAPAFEKMLPYLRSIGKVRHATLHHCHYDMAYEQWKRGIVMEAFDPEYSGGAMMEMGVYPVAAMIRLYGTPDHVMANGVKLSNGIDVSGSILMAYEDMTAQVIYSKISESAMPSQLQGEEGSMLIGEIDNIKDLKICRRKVDQSIHFEQSDNIMHHETDHFLRMIRTGMGMEECKKISLATMKVLEEARKQLDY